MGAPMVTGLPENLDIGEGYTLRYTALDPSTGAEVAAVVITAANFTAQPLGQTTADQLVQPVEDVVLLPIAQGQEGNLFAPPADGTATK